MKFFLNTSNEGYLRGLEAEFGDSSNAIRLELNRFEKAGLLQSVKRGNRKWFEANERHPLFSDLKSIVSKYTGVELIVEKIAKKLGALTAVYVDGELAQGKMSETIDLVFFGDIDFDYLERLIKNVEKILNKNIKFKTLAETEQLRFELNRPNALLIFSN